MLISFRASLVFATQTWLAETPEQAGKAGTPSYLSIGMSGQLETWRLSDLRGLTTCSHSHGRGGGQSIFGSVVLNPVADGFADVFTPVHASGAR